MDPIRHKTTITLIIGFFIKKLTQFLVFGILILSVFLSWNSDLIWENHSYITGSPIHVTRKEQISVITIVFVRTLKYAPATPPRRAKGIKMTIVLKDDPIMEGIRYFIA